MNNNNQQYNTPATFVNVKRVRIGEQDSKGREKTVLTFGLVKGKDGEETNSLDALIAALLPYQGKQVNFSIHMEEKESNGRTFPSAFVKITEMIPKGQEAGATKTVYTPKVSKGEATKARSEQIRNSFNSKG